MAPSTPPQPSSSSAAPPPVAPPPRPLGDGVDPTADRMLAAARQGSNRAWAALVQRTDPECRRLVHLVLGGHGVDQTLLNAYVRAFRARRKGGDDAVIFMTHHVWIACGHEIRRHQRREAPAPGRRAVQADRRPRLGADPVGKAVTDLRPEERAVWGLVDQAGFPIAAVSSALGVDPRVVTTVAARVARLIDEAIDVSADATGPLDMARLADPDAPALDHPGDDTQAVLATEPATTEEPAEPVRDEPDVDPGSIEPDPPMPGFWPELGRRLQLERDAPQAAPPPLLPEPGDSPSLDKAKAPPVAMQKRPPRRSRRRRPDVVEELAGEVDRQRPRRAWGPILVKTTAVLVVLGVLAGAVWWLYDQASDAESPVRGKTVADIAAESMMALADAGTWSVTLTRTALADLGESRSTVTLTTNAKGSYRVQDESTTLDGQTAARITTYDAEFRQLQDALGAFPPRVETGVPLGAPDGGPPRDGMPLDDLGIAARALAAIDDEAPETTKENGRDVWRLEAPLSDTIDVTFLVDRSNLLPVRISWTVDGTSVRDLRFGEFDLGAADGPYAQTFDDAPPATDLGWAPVGITEVADRIDQEPFTPEYLPDGFMLDGVAVNEADRTSVLRYARGPQEVLISLRPSPVAAGAAWDDPFTRPEGQEVAPRAVALEDGPFAGVSAQQVDGPQALPSIWGADGTLAFTVAGDVSADELTRIAQSLRDR